MGAITDHRKERNTDEKGQSNTCTLAKVRNMK